MKIWRFVTSIFLTILLMVVFFMPVMAQAGDPPVEPADFMETFGKAAVGGVPIIAPIFFLVELVKAFKRKDGTQAVGGNWLLVVSLAIGVLLGSGYMVFATRPPESVDWWVQYTYWFGLGIYGLTLGGLTSIGYELVKGMIGRVLTKYMVTRDFQKPPEFQG